MPGTGWRIGRTPGLPSPPTSCISRYPGRNDKKHKARAVSDRFRLEETLWRAL